jgi:hypothetical protein
MLDTRHLKDGDVRDWAISTCPAMGGHHKTATSTSIRCFWQGTNENHHRALIQEPKAFKPYGLRQRDFDNDKARYAYRWTQDVHRHRPEMQLSYQLCTFQGSRTALLPSPSRQERGLRALRQTSP